MQWDFEFSIFLYIFAKIYNIMRKIEHQVINGIESKWCGKCKQWKPLECFVKNNSAWDGLQTHCNDCKKQYRQDHTKEIAEYNKQYRQDHTKEIADKSQMRRSTIVGTAKGRLYSYVAEDRKHGRIGNKLPNDYVTLSDVLRIMTMRCKYCGKIGWRNVGLNRLDDFLPHIKSNVEPCCQSCNKKKSRPTRKRNTELRKQIQEELELVLN